VAGAGETLLPVTVTTMVRPAGLLDEDDDDDEEEDELDEVLVVVVPPGSSPEPPQAVRASARASPAAYEIGTRSVIFVTNPSLNSAV
jgi:hypothetical protein